MEKDYQQFGDVFRDAFHDFEELPSHSVWKGLSRKLLLRRLLKISYTYIAPAIFLGVVAIWLFGFDPFDSKIVTNDSGKPALVQKTTSTDPVLAKTVETVKTTRPIMDSVEHPEHAIPAKVQKNIPIPSGSISKEVSKTEVNGPVSSRVSKPTIPDNGVHQEVTKPLQKEPVVRKDPVRVITSKSEEEAIPVVVVDPVENKIIESAYSICSGEEVSLTAPEGWRYEWNTGDYARNISVKPTETSTYQVDVEDRDGGKTTARFTVNVLECSIYIPRAFSPNDDGSNDLLLVRGDGINQFEMKVYSKWGELMFETRDISQGWDGRFRGNRAPLDAYIYQIRFTDESGRWHNAQGTVTLVP
ncbi:MAG TPA: hypothetical protein DCR43_03090 [Bacteroidales bacterium]|nr:MAG: hypothetical protein A2X11_13710 [Bacteroidetes bacterium GWE2_42_24]OFY30123.1 MAG: hypothetical protein A2X09_14065 [Bacteroidetes bacterium GWF2_43_11]HAQ64828.1 hypothetical protein [Bacteroidales bacterium]HBZ67935.1 hypothetical protein [Bacteroidales bacterium]